MHLLTQACLLERYCRRLNLNQLAALLELKMNTIHKKVAMGIGAARDWMSNAELADSIHAAITLVQRTVASPPMFNTSCKHFEILLESRLRHAAKGAPIARGQE